MARAVAAYYARDASPFADFTTAPEISQAFGEVLGAWAAVVWAQMGRPDPVLLVELGPGRGTLMADALRAVASVAPDFRMALRLHLVEASVTLRETQARALPNAIWHETLVTLPDGPVILIGNEFLDALPIRQFVYREGTWMERHVEAGRFILLPPHDAPALPDHPPVGAMQEACMPARALAVTLGARLARQGGAALFLDYGPAASGFGDSLQAMRGHARHADPLAEPGTADLTAHVDFAAFAEAARGAGANTHGALPQGLFLARIGLMRRAAMLAQSRPRLASDILSGAERLVAAEGMGRLFKALVLCDPALPAPPGFEAA